MAFSPIAKLEVFRTLSRGVKVAVGTLAQNSTGVYFQYDAEYLQHYSNLSPFHLQASGELQLAPKSPHLGLHGAFADSLPDGWGLLLQDRVFRQNGILPNQVTAMDRLAFVGDNAMGALSFQPVSSFYKEDTKPYSLTELGQAAQVLFDGQTEEVLSALVAAGSSGGARPKAQLYFAQENYQQCHTQAQTGDEAWLIKFTSQNLPLGHEEGKCEAVYLSMANAAGLNPPAWRLFEQETKQGVRSWLGVKRFDVVESLHDSGRLHFQSAAGLLDADFRMPSLDYETLIKASRVLCQSPAAGQMQFKRAMFNLFVGNQDDHAKNWGFLQDDAGQWQLAPFYDVTFSPSLYGEHSTAFAGFGKAPPVKAVQDLAKAAGFASWDKAKIVIQDIVEATSGFESHAKQCDLDAKTTQLIAKHLADIRAQNQALWQ